MWMAGFRRHRGSSRLLSLRDLCRRQLERPCVSVLVCVCVCVYLCLDFIRHGRCLTVAPARHYHESGDLTCDS
ncbi:hypothetical protein V5799_000250 [Amblyomma americanum]|uniref:Uncharacterized protein n=1 Tax=Amblyomma americanum TaxID=6943 RepID=A0AAQ4D3L0_AMBAM